MRRTRPLSVLGVVVAVTTSLVVGAAPATPAVLSGALDSTLAREPQVTPEDLGADRLDGLQYADPAENLDLVGPPEADNQGGAGLTHPLTVPAGRAGVEPTLELTYDSGSGNGWLGTGWDLGLGAVEVDTRWGAPLFCPAAGSLCGEAGSRDVESETYVLDGDLLSPTAVRYPFAARQADKADWTRRSETEWERIVRHGDSPTNYWWEVTDKSGTTRYYGGTPEGARDEQAIFSDADGNAVRWGLSAVRDISSNVMRITYDQPDGTRVGAEGTTIGTGFYPRSITYTGSLAAGVPDDPAYEIVFQRDGDYDDDPTTAAPSPVPPARDDVVVDASAGALEVTSDLLRRVEVRYGSPVAAPSLRDRSQVLKAWDLVYETRAFGKSLLTRVDQVGADGAVAGSHTFGYYDEVGFGAGTYDGFDTDDSWTTGAGGANDLDQFLLDPVPLSALGASETNSGDFSAYIGFNPTNPTKTGSFGGAIAVGGGGTGGLVEMMDLNGDLLPDKVYRTNITGSSIKYRLNTSGPDGGTTFGPAQDVTDITTLSTEANVGISGGPEAYFGLSVQFNIAADVSIGEQYFTDVNNDGLPDYVDAGRVFFNQGADGEGKVGFSTSSAGTPVPIDDGTLDLSGIEELVEFEESQREQSPLQDVVRRWVAPYAGTVDIAGAATLTPPPVAGGAPYTGDGVRVAVQVGSDELWSDTLTLATPTGTPTDVSGITVARGQAVYFRVGSIDDGARDRVRWEPSITYTSLGSPVTDANGLSQTVFDAADDFTLAGRPDTPVQVPLRGTLRVEGELTKSAVTSDDVTLRLFRNGTEVVTRALDAAFVGTVEVSEDVAVEAPDADGPDEIVARLAADTPIDPTVLSFEPRLYYTEAFQGNAPVKVLADADFDPTTPDTPILVLDLPYDIDVYPDTDATAPVTPWDSDLDRTVAVEAGLTATAVPADLTEAQRTVWLSVKRRTAAGGPGELVAKTSFVVPPGAFSPASTSMDVELSSEGEYWFDLTVRDPRLSGLVGEADVVLTYDSDVTVDVPETLHRAGAQGVFPIAHRGWAYAGYNAAGREAAAIEEQAFVFDESNYPTAEPTGFDDPGYQDPAQGESYPFTPYLLPVGTGATATRVPVWRGVKENLLGGADFAQSSRTGADSVGVTGAPGGGGASVRGVRRVGVTAPVLGVVAGFGPLSGSFGGGPSFGLLDYVDMNGDSFPDVVAPGSITYTTPRGGYLPGSGDGPDVVGQDTTFAWSGGFGGSAIDVKSNSKGDANTSQDTASASGTAKKPTKSGSAQQGGPAEAQEAGANLGLSINITGQHTNPGSTQSDWSDGLSTTDLDTDAPLERELVDVNGDGLPDQVVASLDGVSVYFNLGYEFSETPVKWAGGAFENGESYSGAVGPLLGFNWNNKEFSGGLSFTEAVDMARYSWVDLDGDGVLDRVRKDGDQTKVAFGSGRGLLPEVRYGALNAGEFALVGDDLIDVPLGEQASQSVSSGVGGGFSFTIPIGPLCLPAPLCYIIVNPGVSYERSLSSTQVQLTDVDGDGYPDSVQSTEDGTMTVRANKRGRTNLLQQVTNPLGGQIRLGYERDGNTEAQPYPVWLMTSVEVDDGRDGVGPDPDAAPPATADLDGADVQVSTFTYEGNRFDPVEREIMGYTRVVEAERDGAVDAAVLRQTVRTYANDTVFDAGLVLSEELQAPDGTPVSRTDTTWRTTDLATGEADPVTTPTTGQQALALLDESRGVVATQVRQTWFTADGDLGTSTTTTYEHDALGNVVRQVDLGQPTTSVDDLVAVTTYSDCRTTSWVSQPATFTVLDGQDRVLRQRDGSLDLCLNAVPIHLEERIDEDTVAVTDLTFDAWGSYDSVTYPENEAGERYRVDYVYDADRHTDIASVVDSHGLTATVAYTPLGLPSERVDANGNATRYTYDAFGRLETVRAPDEQDAGERATVTYAYFPTAPGYAYATASHHDRFNPGDDIQTVSFVDGLGRTTQTKHDGDLVAADAADRATDEMVVSGAVAFDALGREVSVRFPTIEPLGTIGTYQSSVDPYPPTTTDYTLLDQVSRLSLPNGDDGTDAHVTTTTYGFGTAPGLPQGLFVTTTTDALRSDDPTTGTQVVTYTDVRDTVHMVVQSPVTEPAVETRFTHDALGQLVRVVDNAGSVTTHAYDGLGRRLSTETPDAGLRELAYDPAGNVVQEVTPNLRADGTSIDYTYDFDRLVAIDYPVGTPDVRYTYGAPGAPDNGAGRVVALEDGARFQALTYDALGNVATETTTMRVHNLNPQTRDKLTFTTAFEHDSFGRLATLTYPDGEVLAHEYDSGGLLSGLEGTKDCTDLGRLVTGVDALATTLVVTESATGVPEVPFTVRVGAEQLLVTARVDNGDGTWTYTVERGVDGTAELPTAAPHPISAKVTSDEPVTCTYRYLDRQEYDQFLDRRLRATGNGVLTQWAFDYIGRLETVLTETPEREVQDLLYSYDKVDNVLTMANQVPDAVPGQYVAPTEQTYTYDEYYRLESATGTADVAPDKVRTFSWEVVYDESGNVTSKVQRDVVAKANGKGKALVQAPTTYSFGMQFDGVGPHQLTTNGSRSYSYDANGNLTGYVDTGTNERRTVTWDAEDRIVEIDDGRDDTTYTYDADGRRAIERGPDGETSFVNQFYTVRNGSVPWKTIWAGDDRLASKRSFDGSFEHQQYYLHKDLQGSTHVVTDDTGKVFQHWEYFPGGEPWIREDSNVHRTYWMYGGGYLDEVRDLINFGERWYEPREGIFYSPDPLLHRDPTAVLDDPTLLPAYTYASSSPVRFVDPTGLDNQAAGLGTQYKGFTSRPRTAPTAADVSAFQTDLARSSRLWQALVRFAGTEKATKLAAFSKRFEAKPLVQVNLTKTADGLSLKNVELSPFGFVQKEVLQGPAAQDDPGTAASGVGAPQVVPGAGTAASGSGPSAAAAGGSGADSGASSPGAGTSALSSTAGPGSVGPSTSITTSATSTTGASGSSGGGSGSSAVGAVSSPQSEAP